ncbi:kinase-like protein [Ramicandelaber brevisporus]|nr:kinase-like protein [Ramicandelaber brevisporus]
MASQEPTQQQQQQQQQQPAVFRPAPVVLPPALAAKYKVIREIGHGAYGTVLAVESLATGQHLALKKVMRLGDKEILTRRCLREMKLLRHFNGHDNIIAMLDLDIVYDADGGFNDLYVTQELMEADMHQIIKSAQKLTEGHYQYFLYQILRGLKYIHSANVLHRDLKPGNLLVNADCELRICDFGLARGYRTDSSGEDRAADAGFMTEYVATRWYRSPEIMLSFQAYTKAIDIWAVGCIFAEMMYGRPIFRGTDYVDQLKKILLVLGTPDEATLMEIGTPQARNYVTSLGHMRGVTWREMFPNASDQALELLAGLLEFHPRKRFTVEQALSHPYLAQYHDEAGEPSHEMKFNFDFEEVKGIPAIKQLITEEVEAFKVEIMEHAAAEAAAMAAHANSGEPMLLSPTAGGPLNPAAGGTTDVFSQYNYGSIGQAANVDMEALERELSGSNQQQ